MLVITHYKFSNTSSGWFFAYLETIKQFYIFFNSYLKFFYLGHCLLLSFSNQLLTGGLHKTWGFNLGSILYHSPKLFLQVPLYLSIKWEQ